jgi:protocatechuate 3,4-dioxygenase beta subunit
MRKGGVSRRDLVFAATAGAGLFLSASTRHVFAQAALLPATPECRDGQPATKAQTEGPYFTPRSPEKRNFSADVAAGERFTLAGLVVNRRCRPVARALVDLWHADAAGTYDNVGFRLRGHQFTDSDGRFLFDTIIPGLYPGRTRHFHLKIQAPGERVLTTQLYFPDEPANARDGLFNPALVMAVSRRERAPLGRFDIVVG